MTSSLSQTQLEQYRTEGFLAPLPAYTADECLRLRQDIESFGRRHELSEAKILRNKAHLKMPSLISAVTHARVLDAVEGILGPDILCWGSSFFIKEPGGSETVAWHQDSYYWDMEPDDVCVVWVALVASTDANGAMKVVPGTHQKPTSPHHASPEGSSNMLFTYEEAAVQVNEDEAVSCILQQGEMSIHHMGIMHGSGANRSEDRRIGFSITYLAPHVRHHGKRNSAMLVRGQDRYGHFVADPISDREMDPEVLAFINAPYGGDNMPVRDRRERPSQDFYRTPKTAA